MTKIDIRIIGLSVMGHNPAPGMTDHGFKAGGYNRSTAITERVVQEYPRENLIPFYDLEALISSLTPPRRVMLMIQAGKPVDAVVSQLTLLLEQGDIIMDGSNSFYGDTMGQARELEEKRVHYLGVGISGGGEGVRFGPSIIPGDNGETYESVHPILETIAAKTMGEPCYAYIEPDGVGYYVKIVHNGIKCTDIQLIAESYLLLKYVGGFTDEELADTFRSWNQGELHSYLIGITASIFGEQDDLGQGRLIDSVLGSVKQRGTGRWASVEALEQSVDISMITSTCAARIMSNHPESEEKVARLIPSPDLRTAQDEKAFTRMVCAALCTGKIIAHAQGFALMQNASSQYGQDLDLGGVAAISRAECITQATFLNDITHAFEARDEPENLIFDTFLLSRVNEHQDSLRTAVPTGVLSGLPVPTLCNAVSHLDAFRVKAAEANLIQAQRDCFDAHTYERTDHQDTFHH